MFPKDYYENLEKRSRTLRDGDGVRNTHNFIKACLIEQYVPLHAHVLDLGCGQGGDLRKLVRRKLKSYRGLDISHASIEHNWERMSKIKDFKCRAKLECMNFCTCNWSQEAYYDVISCQFALQYAFSSKDVANFVIEQVSKSLKRGGYFIGTIPVHFEDTPYAQVSVQLPDDDRLCLEHNAPHALVTQFCAAHGLQQVKWVGFDDFYNAQKKSLPHLAERMRAFLPPISTNAVFVYQKLPTT